MSGGGWQHDGGTVFTKIEVGAKRLSNPTSAAAHMTRRTTRRADNQELIENLEMPVGRRDRRMERALRRPTDIVTEVVMAVVGEDDEEETAMQPKDASLYRAIVARTNFLAQDRSELQFASKECSRRMSSPRECDWEPIKRIGRYLVGRPRSVVRFPWQDAPAAITVYADSNWAGCKETRKSTSGACFMHGSHLLKSYAKTQSNIALSSAEAELYAFVSAASDAIGLRSMARDFGLDLTPHLFVDATAAIGIAQRKGLGKVRHLDTQALWIQDAVRQRRVNLEKVLGTENPADLMTKHLDQRSIEKCLDKMGVVFTEGRAKTAPMLVNNEPVAMEVQQLSEGVDKTLIIYNDDLEMFKGLAARAKEMTVLPRPPVVAPLLPALPPQTRAPRNRESPALSWADLTDESDGQR
jgi:hypothetical protein